MATIFSTTTAGNSTNVNNNDVTPTQLLGTKAFTLDGRGFRYCKAGAVALVPGLAYQGPASIANHTGIAVLGTPVVGEYTITVTLGATAVTEDQYAGGYMVVVSGTGAGDNYTIQSHPAADASATLTLTLADPLLAVLNGNVDLVANPYNGLILAPATITGKIAGIADYPVTAGQYGWVQCSGVANAYIDSSVGPGVVLTTGGGGDGHVVAYNAAGANSIIIGSTIKDASGGPTWGAVFLSLD